MKKHRYLVLILFLLSIVTQLPHIANAMEYSHLRLKSAQSSEQQAFLSKIDFNVISEEINPYPIESFAISKNGLIALGVNSSNDTLIYVYNTEGNFLYGYQFISSVFEVFFDDENVAIYWGKENFAATFDPEGNCLSFYKTDGYKENNTPKYDGYARPTSGKIGFIEYSVEHAIGLNPQYDKFIIKDTLGNSLEIYNVEKEHNIKFWSYTSVFLIALTIWSICYLFHIKHNKTENQ